MGLGKTIQTIAFADYLFKEQRLRGPFLVVAPKSTLMNWYREFRQWTDYNVLTYDGTKQSREIFRDYEFYYDDENDPDNTVKHLTKFDVLLTSYGMVLSDELLQTFDYGLLVVDEAHRLKNPESKLYTVLQSYTSRHRIFLTGTPLQNNISELWALLNMLEPSLFSSLEEFERLYDAKESDEDSSKKISAFHSKVLKPFMLRRVKIDVELSLIPPKEIVIWLKLTREQKKYFKAIFEQNTDFLYQKGWKNAPSLMNIFMQLRHCCNHPFVLRGVEERTREEDGLKTHDQVMQKLVVISCKMDFLDKFLPTMKAQNHKVLIFSQFVMILDIIEDYLRWKGYLYERIDGNVGLDMRQNSIDRYNSDNDKFVFLLSTRAGGLGINLTSADTVIIYDSDWNPQNDLQAQARAHRIGQKKKVTVYRLVTKGSYEEVMFQKAGKKLGLEKALLHSWIKSGREIEKGKSGNLNKDELAKLIKYGAYHVLREEDDNKPQSTEDILAASEVVDMSSVKGDRDSSFGQATFKNTLDDNLSLDDPNFWEKIGLKKRPMKNVFGKRRRIPVQPRNIKPSSETSSSDNDNEVHGDSGSSFQSDEESSWSKVERSQFEAAFLTFGYGRWEDIKKLSSIEKSDEECADYALGLVKLYMEKSGKTAMQFAKSIKNDLNSCLKRQEEDSSGGIESKNFRVNDLDMVEPIEGSEVLLTGAETIKSLAQKSSYEMLDEMQLDPSLGSTKWKKTRFGKGKNDDLKDLENLWVIQQINKFGWKNLPEKKGIEIPTGIVETSRPTDWWSQEYDLLLIEKTFEHGLEKSYEPFRNIIKEKNLPSASTTALSDSKLRRRIRSFLYKAKTNVCAFLKALEKSIPRPPRPIAPAPPQREPRVTKKAAKAFRRLVITFPIRFPELLSSWAMFKERINLSTNPDLALLRDLSPKMLWVTFRMFMDEIDSTDFGSGKPNFMFDMTPKVAKRYRDRLKLFSNIYQCLDIPNIERSLREIATIKRPMPEWSAKHDMKLLIGVCNHGLGNWEDMGADKALHPLFVGLKTPLPKDSKFIIRLEFLTTRLISLKQFTKKQKNITFIDITGSDPIEKTKPKTVKKQNRKLSKNLNAPLHVEGVKGFVVQSLGKLLPNVKWHTKKQIFPIGFRTSRIINEKVLFECGIDSPKSLTAKELKSLDLTLKDNLPIFRIVRKTIMKSGAQNKKSGKGEKEQFPGLNSVVYSEELLTKYPSELAKKRLSIVSGSDPLEDPQTAFYPAQKATKNGFVTCLKETLKEALKEAMYAKISANKSTADLTPQIAKKVDQNESVSGDKDTQNWSKIFKKAFETKFTKFLNTKDLSMAKEKENNTLNKKKNDIQSDKDSISAKDLFGFAFEKVLLAIERMPGAQLCKKYEFKGRYDGGTTGTVGVKRKKVRVENGKNAKKAKKSIGNGFTKQNITQLAIENFVRPPLKKISKGASEAIVID